MSGHSQTLIGLDLGSNNIKAVELKEDQGRFSLLSLGKIATPPKGLQSDLPVDEQAVIDTLGRLLKEMKITTKLVNSAVPESQVFTRVIEVPRISEKELASALKWEAEQYIPMPLEEVNLDYAVINENIEDRGKMEILLVAAPLKLIDKYTRIIEGAGLTPVSLETEITAAARAYSPILPKGKAAIILNVGASTSDIAVVKNSQINFSRSVGIGAELVFKSISQELGFNLNQAEEYAKTYGIEKDKLEGKLYLAAKGIIDTLVEEIKKTISYYKEKHPESDINVILLSGGMARLPGLFVYIAGEIGIDTQLGDPLSYITKDEKIFGKMGTESSIYGVATGLASKEI